MLSTVACSKVELALCYGSVWCVAPAFQWTSEPPLGSEVGRKLEPFTMIVKEALPGAEIFGEFELTTGTGLGAGLTMKESVLERPLSVVPEWGFSVWTTAVPGCAI